MTMVLTPDQTLSIVMRSQGVSRLEVDGRYFTTKTTCYAKFLILFAPNLFFGTSKKQKLKSLLLGFFVMYLFRMGVLSFPFPFFPLPPTGTP